MCSRWSGIFLVVVVFFTTAVADTHMARHPRYIVLVGPPGAGKGVLAERLSVSEQLPIITTSQVLKNLPEDSDVAIEVKQLMQSGELVPDAIIATVMREELQKVKYTNGVIFDGFPRTVAQADFFADNEMKIESVIVLHADEDTLVRRISGRRVHEASGRVYHLESKPPQVAGQDDVTGALLIQRPDDQEDVVRARLETYRMQTEPVVAWAIFAQSGLSPVVEHVVIIDAGKTANLVWKAVCTELGAESIQLHGCSH